MPENTVRQTLEHRLAELVEEWSAARMAKRLVMQEHNEGIKDLEEKIDGLLDELRTEARVEAAGLQRLPFGPPREVAHE